MWTIGNLTLIAWIRAASGRNYSRKPALMRLMLGKEFMARVQHLASCIPH